MAEPAEEVAALLHGLAALPHHGNDEVGVGDSASLAPGAVLQAHQTAHNSGDIKVGERGGLEEGAQRVQEAAFPVDGKMAGLVAEAVEVLVADGCRGIGDGLRDVRDGHRFLHCHHFGILCIVRIVVIRS